MPQPAHHTSRLQREPAWVKAHAELMKTLNSKGRAKRFDLNWIDAHSSVAFVPAIAAAIVQSGDPDGEMNERFLEYATPAKQRKWVAALAKTLDHPDERVRGLAVSALSGFTIPQAFDALAARHDHSDKHVQELIFDQLPKRPEVASLHARAHLLTVPQAFPQLLYRNGSQLYGRFQHFTWREDLQSVYQSAAKHADHPFHAYRSHPFVQTLNHVYAELARHEAFRPTVEWFKHGPRQYGTLVDECLNAQRQGRFTPQAFALAASMLGKHDGHFTDSNAVLRGVLRACFNPATRRKLAQAPYRKVFLTQLRAQTNANRAK